jgi:hypothetical protein
MIPGRGGGGGAYGVPQAEASGAATPAPGGGSAGRPQVGACDGGGCSADHPGGGVDDPGVAQSPEPGVSSAGIDLLVSG